MDIQLGDVCGHSAYANAYADACAHVYGCDVLLGVCASQSNSSLSLQASTDIQLWSV